MRRSPASPTRLRGAAFPVFVYSAGDLEEPVIHVVLDMVRHLCLTTRAATLTLAASGNGDGVNLCSAWTCGLPVRTRFVNGLPEHDPWLYASERLIGSGEADALLFVDALEAEGAAPPRGVPTVLLTRDHGRRAAAEIVIEVASAARDHDAELYLPRISGIGVVKAAQAATDGADRRRHARPHRRSRSAGGGGPVLIRLQGGRVIDPAHDRDAVGDVFIDDGRIVRRARQPAARPTRPMTSAARSSWPAPSTSIPISPGPTSPWRAS